MLAVVAPIIPSNTISVNIPTPKKAIAPVRTAIQQISPIITLKLIGVDHLFPKASCLPAKIIEIVNHPALNEVAPINADLAKIPKTNGKEKTEKLNIMDAALAITIRIRQVV